MLWDTLVFNELDEMRRDMEALTGWDGSRTPAGSGFACLNVYESKDDYVLAVLAPGIAKDKLDIRLDENSITI